MLRPVRANVKFDGANLSMDRSMSTETTVSHTQLTFRLSMDSEMETSHK